MDKKNSKWKKFFEAKNPTANRKKVARILFFFTIFIFSVFSFRFIYIISVGKVGDVSLDKKTQNHFQGTSIVPAKRGSILDRHGNSIAEDATSYSVYAVLDENYVQGDKELFVHEQDIPKIAKILNEYTGMSKSYATQQLTQTTNEFGDPLKEVAFGIKGKEISLETKNKIEETLDKEQITGIYFQSHPARIYPNGVFASYLIGYADLIDKDDESKGLKGMMGIEEAYNDILSGKNGKITYQKDSRGNKIPETVHEVEKAQDGADIYTTLDTKLQLDLEELLDQLYLGTQPENITAMLVAAESGEILAAGQRPSFNPETREGLQEDEETPGIWANLLIQNPYEPGSTMKVFTVASAIDQGVFQKDEYYTAGQMDFYDGQVVDFDYAKVGKRPLNFEQALIHSSNVGMVLLEQRIGEQNWINYLEKFGFGSSTDSGLPHESPGSLPNTDNVFDIATSAYGQAMLVTSFQMMQGFTMLTNHGEMLKPQYIKKIKYDDENIEQINRTVVGKPVSQKAADETLEMMRGTVEDQLLGTGTAYGIEGYSVSAKTGTAQISEYGANYTSGDLNYLYSVVQIAPTEDPKYIMYVTLKRPSRIESGTVEENIAQLSSTLLKKALDLETINDEIEE